MLRNFQMQGMQRELAGKITFLKEMGNKASVGVVARVSKYDLRGPSSNPHSAMAACWGIPWESPTVWA